MPTEKYNTEAAAEKEFSNSTGSLWIQLAVLTAAALGHLPALGAYWNQDDWGLLGHAAGLITGDEMPARWLSQHAYWHLMYPVFGQATEPYSWSRLLLHGGSAALVARLACRLGLTQIAQIVAGLLFAITPLAFTPLYWAAGIQEILAVFFALLAVERWLAGGPKNMILVILAGTSSILAKEIGLGLPILFAALLWRRMRAGVRDFRPGLAVIIVLTLVAAVEGWLVWHHFGPGSKTAYAFGSGYTSLNNLGKFGWWLVSPWPIFTSLFTNPKLLGGGAVWLVWGFWSLFRWRKGDRLPAACLLASLLTLAPVLQLSMHRYPYLVYAAAAGGALTVAGLLPQRGKLPPFLAIFLVTVALACGFSGMQLRLAQRTGAGVPADPVVLRTAVSFAASRFLTNLPSLPSETSKLQILLLQPPAPGPAAMLTHQIDERWVSGSLLYNALSGTVGPRLIKGPEIDFEWVNGLRRTPSTAQVLVSTGHELRPWGQTPQALQYLTLTDVASGSFERARLHLLRAGLLTGDTFSFFYDPGLMIVTPSAVLAKKDAFLDYLVTSGSNQRTTFQIDAQQKNFLNLLSVCTGISAAELRGSATDSTANN